MCLRLHFPWPAVHCSSHRSIIVSQRSQSLPLTKTEFISRKNGADLSQQLSGHVENWELPDYAKLLNMLEKVLTSSVMEMWDIKSHVLLIALKFSLFFPHSLCGKEIVNDSNPYKPPWGSPFLDTWRHLWFSKSWYAQTI